MAVHRPGERDVAVGIEALHQCPAVALQQGGYGGFPVAMALVIVTRIVPFSFALVAIAVAIAIASTLAVALVLAGADVISRELSFQLCGAEVGQLGEGARQGQALTRTATGLVVIVTTAEVGILADRLDLTGMNGEVVGAAAGGGGDQQQALQPLR